MVERLDSWVVPRYVRLYAGCLRNKFADGFHDTLWRGRAWQSYHAPAAVQRHRAFVTGPTSGQGLASWEEFLHLVHPSRVYSSTRGVHQDVISHLMNLHGTINVSIKAAQVTYAEMPSSSLMPSQWRILKKSGVSWWRIQICKWNANKQALSSKVHPVPHKPHCDCWNVYIQLSVDLVWSVTPFEFALAFPNVPRKISWQINVSVMYVNYSSVVYVVRLSYCFLCDSWGKVVTFSLLYYNWRLDSVCAF